MQITSRLHRGYWWRNLAERFSDDVAMTWPVFMACRCCSRTHLALWEAKANCRARLISLAQFRSKLKGKTGHKPQP